MRREHACASHAISSAILSALPRTTRIEAEVRPDVRTKLLASAAAEATDLRTEILNRVISYTYSFDGERRVVERPLDCREGEEVRRMFEWKLLGDVQDKLLAPADAARETWRAFHAPVVHAAGVGDGGLPEGSSFTESQSIKPAALLLQQVRLTEAELLIMAERWAHPDACILEGRAYAIAVEACEAEARSQAAATRSADARESFLKAVRVSTAKAAGLIVARRPIHAAQRSRVLPHVAAGPEVRIGNSAYLVGHRSPWPACIGIERDSCAQLVGGVDVRWDILADDDSIEFPEAVYERGARSRAPDFINERVVASARERVAKMAPSPLTEFVSMRDRAEAKRRIGILNAHLDTVARMFAPGYDPYAARVDWMMVMHLAVVALRL